MMPHKLASSDSVSPAAPPAAKRKRKRNPSEEAPVTRQEFAALQVQVQALSEEVARVAQIQAVTMVTQEQCMAQAVAMVAQEQSMAQAVAMVAQEQSMAQAVAMVAHEHSMALPNPPHTLKLEESPLETDVISQTASEDFGNVGSGLEEDFPDQDQRALLGRGAEKLGLEWPELSKSPQSLLDDTLYRGQSRRQDFSSVMNIDGTDKDGYLHFPPLVVESEDKPSLSVCGVRFSFTAESLGSDCNQQTLLQTPLRMCSVKLEDCRQTLGLKLLIKKEEEGCGEFLHTGERSKPCSDDGNSPSASGELGQQHEIKTGETSLSFSQCGKSFSQPGNHITHQRIHTREKPDQCLQCGKTFSRSGYLKRHEKIHTGEKPYQCSQCGKAFFDKSNLKAHQRIHTGEKPYHCSQCAKGFAQSGQLKRHQRIHTGEKPYHCSQCAKGFAQSGLLKRHQRIHTGERSNHGSPLV